VYSAVFSEDAVHGPLFWRVLFPPLADIVPLVENLGYTPADPAPQEGGQAAMVVSAHLDGTINKVCMVPPYIIGLPALLEEFVAQTGHLTYLDRRSYILLKTR